MNKSKEEELREEFQIFADSLIWSNDDGSEKYIGVGNMADWIISRIKQELQNQREEIRGEIEKLDLTKGFNAEYNDQFFEAKGFHEGMRDVLSLPSLQNNQNEV